MFLRAGTVPEPGWIAATERFIEAAERIDGATRAAVFRPPGAVDLLHPRLSELAALLRVVFGGGAKPEQGLLIARRFYDAIGGHPAVSRHGNRRSAQNRPAADRHARLRGGKRRLAYT